MLSRQVEIFIDALWKILLPGLTITIPLTIISFAIGMIIAVAVAMVQFANVPVAKQLARFYVWVIRGTPLLVQLFVVFFGFPHIGIVLDPFTSAVIVFSISTGAYCSETIRGSLESVPHGQIEAGYCVGMSYLQIMRRIVMPQALRTAFPALSNSVISLLKDTSLASIITVSEMMTSTKKLVALYYEPMLLYLEVAMIYLIFSSALTKLQRVCEKRLSSYGKNKG